MTEARTEAQTTLSYIESGTAPQRTVTQLADSAVAHMMSEVKPGLFVAWDRCTACALHVNQCQCAGGPAEPSYIAAWRSEAPRSLALVDDSDTRQDIEAVPDEDDRFSAGF